MELKKHTEEAASKVAAVLQRAEEQGQMIESLHTSVSIYSIFLFFFCFSNSGRLQPREGIGVFFESEDPAGSRAIGTLDL
jgi:hypothetical protein